MSNVFYLLPWFCAYSNNARYIPCTLYILHMLQLPTIHPEAH